MPRLDLRRITAGLATLLVLGCTPPVRQFALKNRPLDCGQANQYAYRTLRSMGFNLSALEPATVDRPGAMHGARRTETGVQTATVAIVCHPGGGADIAASEDNSFLGQLEFKRGFYMSFTGVVSQEEGATEAAQSEEARPFAQKKHKGLQVWLMPVPGLGSKLDFNLDLAAGGVLPVLVTVNNVTTRTYEMEPNDLVLIRSDGTRVPPLALRDAAQRVSNAAGKQDKRDAASDLGAVTQRLESRLFTSHSVAPNQRVSGYLYYPLASYTKGRVVLEDAASEEAEGFVVEF